MKNKMLILLIAFLAVSSFIFYQAANKKQLAKEIIAQAYYGDLVAVKNAAEKGAPLSGYTLVFNDPDRQYKRVEFTPLQAAASGGNEEVVTYFLTHGADINQPTPQGWTPLFIALRDGNVEAAKLLIFSGADLNAQTNLGATALTMVLVPQVFNPKEQADLLTYLLKRGANANLPNAAGLTPIYYAVTVLKNPEIVRLLAQNGADISRKDAQGRTLLSLAKAQAGNNGRQMAAVLKKYANKK